MEIGLASPAGTGSGPVPQQAAGDSGNSAGQSAGGYRPAAADSVSSYLGIDPASVDANIRAGKTGVIDALRYARNSAFYEVWNFASLGFVKRNDARLTDVESGQLSEENYYKATLVDATVSVAVVGISGGAAGAVTTRLGTGIAGSAIAAGAAGGALDATVQAGQLGTYATTNGQAGNRRFSGTEFGTSVLTGAVLGGAGRAASDVSIGVGRGGVTVTTPNQSYRLQSPIYPAGSPYQLNSGVPVGVRSPLARLSPPNAAETGPVLTVRVQYTPLEGSEAEFARQLAGQERGINALTAGEIRTNIEKFNAQGRPPGAGGAVGEFRRENPVSEDPFVESYLAQVSQGATPRFAALHEPDLVIGGTVNAVNGYGDLRVNSSLGAQNAYQQDIIYDAVKTVPADTKVRFIFEVKSP